MLNYGSGMNVTLPESQSVFLANLVAAGRFASQDEAVAEAIRRLEADEAMDYLNPPPLTLKEAEAVYGSDPEWEAVELALAGQIKPEA
jgi:putative addiction module CopG family antidote